MGRLLERCSAGCMPRRKHYARPEPACLLVDMAASHSSTLVAAEARSCSSTSILILWQPCTLQLRSAQFMQLSFCNEILHRNLKVTCARQGELPRCVHMEAARPGDAAADAAAAQAPIAAAGQAAPATGPPTGQPAAAAAADPKGPSDGAGVSKSQDAAKPEGSKAGSGRDGGKPGSSKPGGGGKSDAKPGSSSKERSKSREKDGKSWRSAKDRKDKDGKERDGGREKDAKRDSKRSSKDSKRSRSEKDRDKDKDKGRKRSREKTEKGDKRERRRRRSGSRSKSRSPSARRRRSPSPPFGGPRGFDRRMGPGGCLYSFRATWQRWHIAQQNPLGGATGTIFQLDLPGIAGEVQKC